MLPPDFRFPLRAISGVVLGLWGWGAAHAQNADTPPLVLRPSSLLQETITKEELRGLPTFSESNSWQEQTSFQTSMDGQVVLRKGNLLIKADHIDYDQTTDRAKAKGNVYINRNGTVYEGPELELQLEAFEGVFTKPAFRMQKHKAHGEAEKASFLDDNNTVLYDATYTTCQRQPGPNWAPDWFFKGREIHIDSERSTANVEGGGLRFKNIPILPPIPAVDFPIGDERKSGLLPPTIGFGNSSGFEYSQPIYWNLAPNRDLTFTPMYWSDRGINTSTELRYLEGDTGSSNPFIGQLRTDYMAQDKDRESQSRWATKYMHSGLAQPYIYGGSLGFSMNINRVSDHNYWKDFAFTNPFGSQRLLSNDATLSWSNGTYLSSFRVQKWQTLQDLASPTSRNTAPFDRVPQITGRIQKYNLSGGFDASIDADFSRFESSRYLDCDSAKTQTAADSTYKNYANCAPNANRFVTLTQLSRPFTTSYGYVTPKVQLHSRSYQFEDGLPDVGFYSRQTTGNYAGMTSANVSVPTFSLDTGAVLERPFFAFGRNWTQTLEPRLLYVQTPYREQNFLPNYDSGSFSFNLASIFSENAFAGHDRIADLTAITFGGSSRLIDSETGAEGGRFVLAQRLRLTDQNVTVPEYDARGKSGVTDILAGASLNLSRQWAAETAIDYNPNSGNYLHRMIGGRYQPGSYRLISAAYRSNNNEDGSPISRQVEIGWQWPLHDLWRGIDINNAAGQGLGEGRWYGVGRFNYDPSAGRVVDSLIGFEYDAGCWISRIAAERTQLADNLATQRVLFQLELIGMSRVGTNALNALRNSLPRYQPLRQPTMAPSRFGNYD